ncbi:DNA mismatch repair protein MutT [Clostridium polyendosporum]|uniref:DNA mismatch repair protein MutT n=1 Tax=Clostridium polyendosporum TaxID=69208 RepID=A0A919S1I1_9CLOT|nr:NUDIX hydrolase [Clostridium polyendosporum]GIM29719.1 DNA mismatch repair protein MutT [Clostridium polyendosporum]
MNDNIVYDGWLRVYKRKVKNKTYDILSDYDAVSAIVVNEYNDILLVKQFRPALMEETVEIPAGTIDKKDESTSVCITRELKEETGVNIKPEDLKLVGSYKPMVGFSNSLMKVYFVKILKSDLKFSKVKDEDVYEVFWMSFNELEQKISEGKILDIKTIFAYYYIKTHL